jgi:hypothetical protein
VSPIAHPVIFLSRVCATTCKQVRGARATSTNWWLLNNSNCNLHDTGNMGSCPPTMSVDDCKKVCEAHPDCGGFLFYTKDHSFALKNVSAMLLCQTINPPPVPSLQACCSG